MRLSEIQADRAAGVLLGTAAGDALGAGYEFTLPRPEAVIDMIGGGPFNWARGEWTDDTSMALCIAIPAAAGSDIGRGEGLDAVAAQFVQWYDSGPPDIGNQTRTVLSSRSSSAEAMQRVARGMPGRRGGNGSLMRTAPVALAYLDDPAACRAAAVAIGSLTHYDDPALQACEMWSSAIAYAVVHGSFDGVRKYVDESGPAVAEFWAPLLDQAESGTPADFPNNGWVVHALQTAWWAIANSDSSGPQQLPEALEKCVRAGNDTDTTAAIAGGLLGARWGGTAVPARWRNKLHGYPGLRADDLERLALDIVAVRA